jgi:hypothetical protein
VLAALALAVWIALAVFAALRWQRRTLALLMRVGVVRRLVVRKALALLSSPKRADALPLPAVDKEQLTAAVSMLEALSDDSQRRLLDLGQQLADGERSSAQEAAEIADLLASEGMLSRSQKRALGRAARRQTGVRSARPSGARRRRRRRR